MIFMKSPTNRIKEVLAEKGIKQTWLAEKLGKSFTIVNSYVCNRRQLEKPLYFDPFGQIEFAPVGHNIIAPCKVLVQGSILFYPFRDSGFS